MDHCREICLCPDKEGITAKRSCLKGHCSYAFPSGDVKLEILYLQFIFKLFIVNVKAHYNNEEHQFVSATAHCRCGTSAVLLLKQLNI